MNKLLVLLLCLAGAHTASAQISALTENGRQVTLYADGTWQYIKDSTTNAAAGKNEIKLNPAKFSKSASQTFVAKSNLVNVGVFINPEKWTFSGRRNNETNPEYRFALKSGNGMAMLTAEKTPIALESMRNIALINAQKAAIDARITNQEYRVVNGNKVLF